MFLARDLLKRLTAVAADVHAPAFLLKQLFDREEYEVVIFHVQDSDLRQGTSHLSRGSEKKRSRAPGKSVS